MPNPIPDFDHNLVVPPHLGDPTNPGQLSPYPCTTIDFCERFGTSPERRTILGRFLDFRDRLRSEGLTTGFQWLDGSFLEDIETRDNRPPGDMDVVTVYWGYDRAFQVGLVSRFREFASSIASKRVYSLDHYSIDATLNPPPVLTELVRYWILLFSHNRDGIWKGMLKIDINTPGEDATARQRLGGGSP